MKKTGKSGKTFARIYSFVAAIPAGKVMTYGQVARLLQVPCPARVVGYAMHGAPERLGLPCHRVVNRKGEMAPGEIFGGAETQRLILKREGVKFLRDGRVDLDACLFRP